jgi:hypothetical protein
MGEKDMNKCLLYFSLLMLVVGIIFAAVILKCNLCYCYSCIVSGVILFITFLFFYLCMKIPYSKYKHKYVREICKAEILASKEIADELYNRIYNRIKEDEMKKKNEGNTNVNGK